MLIHEAHLFFQNVLMVCMVNTVYINANVDKDLLDVIIYWDVFANLAGLERYVIKTSTNAMTLATCVTLPLQIALTQMVRTNVFVRRDLKMRQTAAPVRC